MKNKLRVREQGQTIVLVLILFLGMLAMLALVLDGGNMYAQRRAAQVAADAGALAGARYLCGEEPNYSLATNDANEYAVNQNEAQTATITFPQEDTIEVTTNIDFVPFFAQVIGFNEFSVSAVAEARCETPNGGNVMPIAWSCPPPQPDEEGNLPEGQLCAYQYNDCGDDNTCEPPLYVFMDKNTPACIDPPNTYGEPGSTGTVDCDWDNDGYDDGLAGTSNRGWVNLIDLSNSNAKEIGELIIDACVNGVGVGVTDHTWIAGQDGSGPNFDTVQQYCIGKEVIIPVFDTVCAKNDTPDINCILPDHSVVDDIIYGGNEPYYHIVGIASFTITSVHAGGDDKGDHKIVVKDGGQEWGSICPGRNQLQFENPDTFSPGTNFSIEGYLNAEISPDVSGFGGADSGTYVITLVK